jgi:formate-dependent nitrite reductase membrane component NrfD
MIAAMLSLRLGEAPLPASAGWVFGGGALLFLAITTVLLVADLKRPERFLYILMRPNWNSWLARGAVVLMAYGAVATAWTASVVFAGSAGLRPLSMAGAVLGALAAAYTGWLFAQSKGRVLWMRRSLWAHLIVQAMVTGAAVAILVHPWIGMPDLVLDWLRLSLVASLVVHGFFVLTEHWMAPRDREAEFARASRLVTHGPYARRHWILGMGLGIVVPALILGFTGATALWGVAAILALIGIWSEEDTLVRAGQALPIS